MSYQSKILAQLRNAIQAKTEYPFGVMAYYGPDDQTVEKIIAIVLPDQESDPKLKIWQGPKIAEDTQTAAEIGKFFQEHKVSEVTMTEGIVGCPHDEGVDFPIGESCPYCPFWSEQEP